MPAGTFPISKVKIQIGGSWGVPFINSLSNCLEKNLTDAVQFISETQSENPSLKINGHVSLSHSLINNTAYKPKFTVALAASETEKSSFSKQSPDGLIYTLSWHEWE